MLTENVYIQQFDIRSDKTIYVRKVTDVLRNGVVIASGAWSTILQVNDPETQAVLGDEPYYLGLAQQAWA